jgi:hypothetical protein
MSSTTTQILTKEEILSYTESIKELIGKTKLKRQGGGGGNGTNPNNLNEDVYDEDDEDLDESDLGKRLNLLQIQQGLTEEDGDSDSDGDGDLIEQKFKSLSGRDPVVKLNEPAKLGTATATTTTSEPTDFTSDFKQLASELKRQMVTSSLPTSGEDQLGDDEMEQDLSTSPEMDALVNQMKDEVELDKKYEEIIKKEEDDLKQRVDDLIKERDEPKNASE